MSAHHPHVIRRRAVTVRQFTAPLDEVALADPHEAWFDEAETADWQPIEADALAPGPAISTPTILSIAMVVMMLVSAVAFAF